MGFWAVFGIIMSNLPAVVKLIAEIISFIKNNKAAGPSGPLTLQQVLADLAQAYQSGSSDLMKLLHPPQA